MQHSTGLCTEDNEQMGHAEAWTGKTLYIFLKLSVWSFFILFYFLLKYHIMKYFSPFRFLSLCICSDSMLPGGKGGFAKRGSSLDHRVALCLPR